ncbi:MAG TPA: DUF302 domain-containing protein [Nitrospirae bacterium]|nr:DUF302 domain-containing protein [Nitrospirota bacterium]
MNNKYSFGKEVELGFDEAVAKMREALKPQGFGILTEIDVAATLKKKLDKDMPPYMILGACNPPIASKALEVEPSIGVLLPCNVVVRQDGDGKVFVEIMDPNAVLGMVDAPGIETLAGDVRQRLEKALEAL